MRIPENSGQGGNSGQSENSGQSGNSGQGGNSGQSENLGQSKILSRAGDYAEIGGGCCLKRKLFAVLIVLTLAFIWGHSMMNADTSSAESDFVLLKLKGFLEIFAGKGRVSEHFVRKLAHFTEFAGLGFELIHFFPEGVSISRRDIALSCGSGLAAAFADEGIQLFNDRSAQLSDVCLDFCGVCAGVFVIVVMTAILLTMYNGLHNITTRH